MMFDRVCSGENLHYLIRAAVIRMSDIALMTFTALLRLLSASGDSTAAWNGGVGKFSHQMATEFLSIGQGSPIPPYSGDVWPGFLPAEDHGSWNARSGSAPIPSTIAEA